MSLKTFGLFCVCAATTVFGFDSDPGYGPRPTAAQQPTSSKKGAQSAAGSFRPTMRYYGPGYTVAYRYIPWTEKMPRTLSTSFESDQLHLQAVAAKGAAAEKLAPKATYYYATGSTPASPRTPVTPATPAIAAQVR